ncbi:MAG: lipid-A-disaccharide synthase, partial [Nitrosomonadales bacterium]|nr:lipid-A-disaccharide synthase [Nitrosomonadales bacterium]
IKKIKAAASHMLALFPFETAIYQEADIPVTYVGHPLADILPIESDMTEARINLKLTNATNVIAMLPGSRQSEVKQLARLYVRTARLILNKHPSTKFLIPLVTKETRTIFQQAIYDDNAQDLPLQILFGHAHMAMQAADAVIVASGTATLEAALIKRPMVITYRMPSLSWQLLKRMNYLPYVGLPNILAERFVVPELLQHDATPEKLAEATLKLIEDKTLMAEIREEFTRMHMTLRQNTEEKAADAILAYL